MTASNLQALLQLAASRFAEPSRREDYFQIYAPSIVLHRSPPIAPGIEAVKEYYRRLWAAFPDITLTIGTTIVTDDFLANEFTIQGTHRGTFLGIEATGRPMKCSGLSLMRFESARCVERWSQTDMLGMVSQLGGRIVGPSKGAQ